MNLILRGGVLYEDNHEKTIHRVNNITREHVIEHISKSFYYIEFERGHYNVRKADIKHICKNTNLDMSAIKKAPKWCSVAPIV